MRVHGGMISCRRPGATIYGAGRATQEGIPLYLRPDGRAGALCLGDYRLLMNLLFQHPFGRRGIVLGRGRVVVWLRFRYLV